MEKEKIINALIQALKEAECNAKKLQEDGAIGKETILALDVFFLKSKSSEQIHAEQINAVIKAMKDLLEIDGEKELAGLMKAEGKIDPVAVAAIRKIIELYEPCHGC